MKASNLDEYLTRYGHLLGGQADKALSPHHVPGRDDPLDFSGYLRQPYPAQAHVVTGVVKALKGQSALFLCGQIGTGKTIMGALVVHELAAGRPYRALLMVPGHLVNKWERELRQTIPGVTVTQLEHCAQLNKLRARRAPPSKAEWYVVGRDRVKLGAQVRPAALRSAHVRGEKKWRAGFFCPGCHRTVLKRDGNLADMEWLEGACRKCERVNEQVVLTRRADGRRKYETRFVKCDTPLWTYIGKQQGGLNKFEMARYVHKRLRGYFTYYVLDEAHEEKSATSAQGEACGCLAAAVKKKVALTGSLIGGQANHVRALLFRLCPRTLVQEGLTWANPGEFDKRYGRIETTIREPISGPTERSGKMSRAKRSSRDAVRPGVMPALFGRHLLGNVAYLELDQLAENLPEFAEYVVGVDMDAEQRAEYERIDKLLREANSALVKKGDRRLLGAMLQTLLFYPDLPHGWPTVGYWEGKKPDRKLVPVVDPADLDEQKVRPKEAKLLELVRGELKQGRKVWVYVQGVEAHDVCGRLTELLNRHGVNALSLRSGVDPTKREEWINRSGPRCQVVVSRDDLVKTGLDFFDKEGRTYNFPTIVFYETGYNYFTMRQAAGRAYRLLQWLPCRVYYLYYEGTMQATAMQLMGRKQVASLALEGKFSADGLAALGGDDATVEMALARSLDKRLTDDALGAWQRIDSAAAGAPVAAQPPPRPARPPADDGDDEELEAMLARTRRLRALMDDDEPDDDEADEMGRALARVKRLFDD